MKIRHLKSESELKIDLPLEACSQMQQTYNPVEFGWLASEDHAISFVIEKKIIFKKLTLTSEIMTLRSENNEDKKQFLEEVVKKVKEMGVHFISQSPAFIISPFVPSGAIACPFGTLQIDLRPSEDQLMASVHSKHRNVIKKAMNENLIIEQGAHCIADCASLIGQTMSRQLKDSVSLSALKFKKEKLGDNLRFYVIKKDGVLQGCAVIAWKKGSKALYLYGGSCQSPSAGALNYLQWSIMLDMKKEGVLLYDLVGARINPPVGSKYEGIQRFKERMGAQLVQGYLWKMPLNKLMYSLYQWLIILRNYKYEKKIISDVIDEEAKRLKESTAHV